MFCPRLSYNAAFFSRNICKVSLHSTHDDFSSRTTPQVIFPAFFPSFSSQCNRRLRSFKWALEQQPQTLSVTRDEGVVDLLHFQYLHKEILIRHKQIVARCASILNEQERKKYLTKITFQISFSLWAGLFKLFSRLLNKYRLETDFTRCIKCND